MSGEKEGGGEGGGDVLRCVWVDYSISSRGCGCRLSLLGIIYIGTFFYV